LPHTLERDLKRHLRFAFGIRMPLLGMEFMQGLATQERFSFSDKRRPNLPAPEGSLNLF
jgi:hypothetical protein